MSDWYFVVLPRFVFGAIVACLATTALAQASSSSAGDERPVAEAQHRNHPDYHGRHHQPPIEPVIVVPATPDEGGLPSTYVPDDYRLPGYDGKPAGPRVCSGDSGRSWSTEGRECPPGQRPETGGRSWSTSP